MHYGGAGETAEGVAKEKDDLILSSENESGSDLENSNEITDPGTDTEDNEGNTNLLEIPLPEPQPLVPAQEPGPPFLPALPPAVPKVPGPAPQLPAEAVPVPAQEPGPPFPPEPAPLVPAGAVPRVGTPRTRATAFGIATPKLKVDFVNSKIVENIINLSIQNTNVFVINPNKLNLIGGTVVYGGEGVEEDLMRASPSLYKSLTQFGEKNTNQNDYMYNSECFDLNTNTNTNNDGCRMPKTAGSKSTVHGTLEKWNTNDFIIITQNADIYRDDNNKLLNDKKVTVFTVKIINKDFIININSYFVKIISIIKSSAFTPSIIKTIILDPLSLFNDYRPANIQHYANYYINFFNSIINNNIIIKFVINNPGSTIDPKLNDYKNFYTEFDKLNKLETDNAKKITITCDTLWTTAVTAGGYLKQYKYISPINKQMNKKNNTKKNNTKTNIQNKISKRNTKKYKNKKNMSKKNEISKRN